MKMICVNLFGGPNAGKSVAMAQLFAQLKCKGIRAEMAYEVARDFILKGQTDQFDNQLYIFAKQYSRIRNLERHKCEVAISDSPLIQGLSYASTVKYTPLLREILPILEEPYHVLNILVKRVPEVPFDTFGRVQKNNDEAVVIDRHITDFVGGNFDLEIYGNPEGHKELAEFVAGFYHMNKAMKQADEPQLNLPFPGGF